MKRTAQMAKMLEAARTLFWKNGFRSTSMREIAKAYGCTPANIYNFFSTKEDILYEVLLEELEQLVEPIRHLEADNSLHPEEQLRFIIETHVKLALSRRWTSKLLFDVGLQDLSPTHRKKILGMRDSYDHIIRTVILRGIEQKCFAEIDEKLAGIMIASMITRTRIWYRKKRKLSVPELAEFILQFSLNGLKGHMPGSSFCA